MHVLEPPVLHLMLFQNEHVEKIGCYFNKQKTTLHFLLIIIKGHFYIKKPPLGYLYHIFKNKIVRLVQKLRRAATLNSYSQLENAQYMTGFFE